MLGLTDPGLQASLRCFCPSPGRQDSLRDGVLSGLDLAEELLWDAVVEGELAVEHGEEHHTQGPHVTRLSPVRPACGHTDTRIMSTGLGKRMALGLPQLTSHLTEILHMGPLHFGTPFLVTLPPSS